MARVVEGPPPNPRCLLRHPGARRPCSRARAPPGHPARPGPAGAQAARIMGDPVLPADPSARQYRSDDQSPLAAEVRSVFRRTVGIDQRLRAALEGLPGVEAAAILGSYAAGTDRPGSDIDVLVIGHPDRIGLSDR